MGIMDAFSAEDRVSVKFSDFYMDNVRDCIESRADTELQRLKEQRETPLYLQTARYATEHGEQALFRASHNANVACRDDIEAAIKDNYDGSHLNTEAIFTKIRDKFGPERMKYVLAATVQDKEWDGRYSAENKAWARTVPVADGTTGWGGNRNTEFMLNRPHAVLVDALVTHARREFAKEQELPEKKPSVLEKLKQPYTKNSPQLAANYKGQER